MQAAFIDCDIDDPHAAVWEGIRHLFPAHAAMTQVDYGVIMVSWTLRNGRRGSHWAAPIMISIASGLLLALWTCEPEERGAIASVQADTVHEALAGYDPLSRVPTCPVIALGD